MAETPRKGSRTGEKHGTLHAQRKWDIMAAEFFANGCNLKAAYIKAGYRSKNPNSTCVNLLRNPKVQAAFRQQFERLQARLDLQQDRTLLELCRVGYSDLRKVATWGPWGVTLTESADLPDDVAAAVQHVTMRRLVRTMANGEDVEEVRVDIKLHEKTRALALLQEFFRRGDPLSTEAENQIRALLLIMAQYVSRDRLDAFRAHVHTAFGLDIPGDDSPAPHLPRLVGDPRHGNGTDAPGGDGTT